MINIKPKKRLYAKPVFLRQPGQEKSQSKLLITQFVRLFLSYHAFCLYLCHYILSCRPQVTLTEAVRLFFAVQHPVIQPIFVPNRSLSSKLCQ